MFSLFSKSRRKAAAPDPISPAHGALFQDLFGAAAITMRVNEAPDDATPDHATLHDTASPATLHDTASPATSAGANDPDSLDAARNRLQALVEAEDFAEVEALIARLPAALDDEPWLLDAGMRLFARRGQHDRALQVATQLQQAAPKAPGGYLGACTALGALGRWQEAEAVAERGLRAGTDSPELEILAAHIAETNGDADLAQARWAQLRAAWPGILEGYVRAVQLSMRCKQHLISARVLADGLARFPKDATLLLLAAREAVRSLQWKQAVQHWQTLMAMQPENCALAFEAATSLLGEPADRKQRLPQMIALLDEVHARFDDFVPAYTAHVDALRELGKLEQAAALGATARARFPGNAELTLACARVAESKELYRRAVSLIETVRGQAPANLQVETAYIRALSLADDRDAAEAACQAAIEAFPGNFRVVEQHVLLASRHGDFAEASRRAEQWRGKLGNHDAVIRLANRMLSLHNTNVLAGHAADSDLGQLFARFESLGATFGGCEFGTIQSHFGAEPISLLRWGNMRVAGLSRALQARFEGLGDPDNTVMVEQAAGANASEYFVKDERYGYWAHTFMKTDEAPRDKVFRQTCRRLAFLRDKLIEDLEAAEKIFVFKVSEFDGVDELLGLFANMRTYGPCTLLCATLEDAEHASGSVEMLQPGFFLGRVGMFGNALGQTMRGMDYRAWSTICREVASWHDART